MISTRKLWQASAMLALFAFLAKLTGLARDRILASLFGASTQLDVYYSAFRLPDLIFNIFILGAVSSAFIPVFLEYYRNDTERAWRVTQNFINVSLAAVVLMCAVFFVFAEPLSVLVAPGFSGQDRATLIQLLRIMLLSPVIFAVSTTLGSILQALERFISYAIAPILYNVGIIAGAVYLVPLAAARGFPAVLGLGLGVLAGALLHALIQLPSAIRVGFRFKWFFSLGDEALRKIVTLMIPRTIGTAAYSVQSIITNALASTLAVGSITVFNLADSLQFVPISVLGISAATAIFPRLTWHAAGGERAEFREKLRQALGYTAGFVALVTLGMFLARESIVRLLFQTGAFRGADAQLTASVLGIFLIGVIAQSLIPIMSRAFFALQNTKIPMFVSLIAILLNIGLGVAFTFFLDWGIRGLAAAFAIAGNVHILLLLVLFKRKYW